MKQLIENLIKKSIETINPDNSVNVDNIRIDRTKDRAHGDFATNIAMLLAKPLKQAPRQIAQSIIDNLPKDEHISKVEIAGPGFINFFINKSSIADALEQMNNGLRLGVAKVAEPKTIVVDYSAPNVAKEMAVHHIRSTVIGDAVVRVLEFLGNKVIRANHIGDWGTQFGMLIAYLEKKENESGQGMDLSDFEAFYREAKECYDTDEEFAVKARHYVVLLQGGDEYCRSMWKKLVNMTMVQNQKLYDRLDVTLSDKDIMIMQGSVSCEKILNGKCKHIKIFICSMDTITSFQKKHGNLKTIELLKATGAYIKIIDEIHRDIRAVSMIEALNNFRLNYYMAAAPGRAEQKENWIFRTLFKNVPSFGSTFKTQEEKHITVMIKKFKWTPDYKQIKAMVNNKTGLNIKAYERELINSPQFQRQSFDDAIMVLLNWAKGVMKPGKRLMLMAQSIETLFYIQKLAEKVFPGETGVYYGGLSKKEKELAIEKKIIIATDSSLGTGANIPELQFLIYCSTYSNWLNARQISGRLRKLNDGTQVVYIELLNVGYLKTMKQFDKRKGELQRRSKTGKLFFVE